MVKLSPTALVVFDDNLPRQIDQQDKVDQQTVQITTTQFVTFERLILLISFFLKFL